MMRGTRIVSLILLATFIITPIQPIAESNLNPEMAASTSGRSTGIDLSVSDVSFSYPSFSDD